MDDERLTHLLTLLSDLMHEARALGDRIEAVAEQLKDIERPGWDEGIPRSSPRLT